MYIKEIINVIKNRKFYFILSLLIFALGIALAFFLVNEVVELIFYEKIISLYTSILLKEISLFSLLIKKIFTVSLFFAILVLFSIKIYLVPIHFIIFLYQGFVFGLTVIEVVYIFNFVGIIISLFVIIPTMILLILLFVIFSLSVFDRLITNHNNVKFCSIFQCFLPIFIFSIFTCIVEIFLLFIILRPLDFLL